MDPVAGRDNNTGAGPTAAFKTFGKAWAAVPAGVALTQPTRIRIMNGTVPASGVPQLWEKRWAVEGVLLIQGHDCHGAGVPLSGWPCLGWLQQTGAWHHHICARAGHGMATMSACRAVPMHSLIAYIGCLAAKPEMSHGL